MSAWFVEWFYQNREDLVLSTTLGVSISFGFGFGVSFGLLLFK